MKLIRKVLVNVLGLKGYLRLVSSIYIRLVSLGFLKSKYPELFFLDKNISPGETVVDIGANLAYYSTRMARNIGVKGKLIAVEPIPLFADIWKRNMRHKMHNQVHLCQYALGSEPQADVRMSIPLVNGVVRHGLTKVVEDGDDREEQLGFDVEMKVGDDLLKEFNLTQLDYIKCDVEGYEQYVIPSIEKTIEQYQPMFQIELGGKENRQNVVDFLTSKGYEIFTLKTDKLIPLQKSDIFSVNTDFYFIHQTKKEKKSHLIQN